MLYFLIVFIFLLVLIEFWAIRLLFRYGISARFTEVKSLQHLGGKQINASDYYKTKIADASWLQHNERKLQYSGALSWVMNKVTKYAPNPTMEPESLLKAVESGEGAICHGMTILYQNTLAAAGLSSRVIFLQRNMFDTFDSHVTVEVFLDDKWVIMDPTFNISFADSEGRLLSAQDIKSSLVTGSYRNIEVISYGRVAYPNRLDNYYMDYLPYYNNVFILGGDEPSFFAKLPPFRFWFGPKIYYERVPLESISHLNFAVTVYFFVMVILPAFIVMVALMIIMSLITIL